jgi:hypothetical protein
MITTSTTSHLEGKKQQQQHRWEDSTAFSNYLNFYILIQVVYFFRFNFLATHGV